MNHRGRVCVVGNSVGFRIRPPRQHEAETTYSEHLARWGFDVRNVCRSGVTVAEAFGRLEEDVLTFFPQFVVVQFGVVELCYRRTWRRLNNAAIRNYYVNSIVGTAYRFDSPLVRPWRWSIRAANALTSRTAQALGLQWQWLPAFRFLEVLQELIGAILKETAARVFVLGVPPPSPRIERILAGSAAAVAEANSRMADQSLRLGPRVAFVDTQTWLGSDDPAVLMPDGIHLSARAHHQLAEVLARMMDEASGLRADS